MALSAQTVAEINRKASLGIPLTNQSNAQANDLYKKVSTPKPVPSGVSASSIPSTSSVPKMAAPTTLAGAVGSTVANSITPKVSTGSNIPSSPATNTSVGSTPKFTPNPIAPKLNQTQLDYFGRNYGGIGNYVNTQNTKYNNAILLGDTNALNALNKDAGRVGYALTDTYKEQADKEAEKQYNDQVARLNAEKEALQNNFEYGKQIQNDNRVLEDLSFARKNNPYSGGSDYRQAMLQRGRQIDDSYLTAGLNSQLNAIDQQIAGLDRNSLAEEIYNDSLSRARGQAIDLAGLTGNIAGQPTLAARSQQFNQDLANRQQNLSEMQIMADLIGKLPDGTPTNAYQQQQLENLWALAEQTGVIPNELADMYGIPRGTQTQAAKQFAMNFNRNAFESDRNYSRGVLESDRNYNRGVLESDRNYNLDLSRESRLSSEGSGTTVDPYKQLGDVAEIIDKSAQYVTDPKDVTGKKVLANQQAVEAQILNSGLPEYQMWQLYQRYGIPWEGSVPSPN